MDTRWQRLNIPISQWKSPENDLRTKWLGQYVDRVDASNSDSALLPSEYGRHCDMYYYYDQLVMKHYQMPSAQPDVGIALRDLKDLAVDFFTGPWRNKAECSDGRFNREECRQKLEWIDLIRIGLMAAILSEDDRAISGLASYIDDDLPFDPGSWNRTTDDRLYYILLGQYLSLGQMSGLPRIRESLDASRRRRPKILLQCLVALSESRREEFLSAMLGYVKMFKKQEFREDGRMLISWDATILWNLARTKVDLLVDLPEESMDFIITRESLGLDQC